MTHKWCDRVGGVDTLFSSEIEFLQFVVVFPLIRYWVWVRHSWKLGTAWAGVSIQQVDNLSNSINQYEFSALNLILNVGVLLIEPWLKWKCFYFVCFESIATTMAHFSSSRYYPPLMAARIQLCIVLIEIAMLFSFTAAFPSLDKQHLAKYAKRHNHIKRTMKETQCTTVLVQCDLLYWNWKNYNEP